MARDDEFDIDQFDNFESSDFDIDFGDVTADTESNRSPITKTKKNIASGLKSSVQGIGKALDYRIRNEFPATNTLVGQGMKAAGDLKYLSSKFQQDIQPSINVIKRAGRQLSPKIKQVLPKKFHDKLDSIFASSDTPGYQQVKAEEARQQNIEAQLGAIFGGRLQDEQQVTEEKLEETKDKIIDRALEDNRHKESFNVLDKIRLATEFNANFTKSIYTAYLKKDLELKYKHYFVAQDTLATTMGIAKLLETKLDQIRHNTALPEIQKLKKTEAIKEVMSQRFSEKVYDLGKTFVNKVADKIFKPVTSGIQMGAYLADTLVTMEEMADQFGPKRTPLEKAISFAADKLGGRIGGKFGNYLFGDGKTKKGILNARGQTLEGISQNAMTHLGLWAQSKKEDYEFSNPFLSTLFDFISPDVSRGAGSIKNIHVNDPLGPAVYDNAARTSLVEIIPGLLAKIEKNTKEAVTGQNQEELVYDYNTRDFITSSEYKKNTIDRVFGTREQNARNLGAAVGVFRGAYSYINKTEELQSFDDLVPELGQFIVNSGLQKRPINLGALSRYIDGITEEIDDTYIGAVMKGIEHKKELAELILATITYDDGTINYDIKSKIDRQIIDYMGKDEYLNTLPKYLQGYGTARHLKGILDVKGSSAKISDDFIRGVYGRSKDLETHDQIETYTKYTTDDLEKQEERLLDTPKEVAGILDSLFAVALKGGYSSDTRSGIGGNISFIPKEVMTEATKFVTSSKAASFIRKKIENYNERVRKLKEAEKKSRRAIPEKPSYVSNVVDPYAGDFYETDATPVRRNVGRTRVIQQQSATNTSDISNSFARFTERFIGEYKKVSSDQYNSLSKIVNSIAPKTTNASNEPVVKAIEQFENTFKDYVKKQDKHTELLEKIADISSEMNDKLLNIVGNTSSTIMKLFHKGKALTKTAFSALWNTGWELAKLPFTTKPYFWTARQIGKAGRFAWEHGGSQTLGFLKGLPANALRAGVYAGQLTRDAISGVGGAVGSLYRAGTELVQSAKNSYVDHKNNMRSWFNKKTQGLRDKLNAVKYTDIYLKGEIAEDKILVTKQKQESEEGVVFGNGNRVLTSWGIDKPVFDPETKQCLITKEQLETGIVDVNGDSLNRKGLIKQGFGLVKKVSGLFGSGINKLFGIGKDLLAGNPLFKLMNLGIDIGGSLFRGGKTLLSRLFGVDTPATRVTREVIQELITKRLDDIYTLLQGRLGKETNQKPVNEPIEPMKSSSTKEHERALETINKAKSESEKEKTNAKLVGLLENISENTKEQVKVTKRGFKESIKKLGGSLLDKLGSLLSVFGGVFGLLKDIGGGLFSLLGGKMAKDFLAKASGKAIDKIGEMFGKKGAAKLGESLIEKEVGKTAGKAVAKTAAETAVKAGGGVATKSIAKTVAKTAGKSVLKKLGGAALSLAGGPVGWVVGGAMLIDTAMDVYGIYKEFTTDENDLIHTRAKLYGIDLKASRGGWNPFASSYESIMLELEEKTLDVIRGEEKPLDSGDLEDIADWFGFDDDDEEQVKYVATWYRQRFIPVFNVFLSILDSIHITYEQAKDLDGDIAKQVAKKLIQDTAPKLQSVKSLVPNMESFQEFKKIKKTVSIANVSDDERVAARDKIRNNASITGRSDKYGTSTADILAANRASKTTTNTLPTTTGAPITRINTPQGSGAAFTNPDTMGYNLGFGGASIDPTDPKNLPNAKPIDIKNINLGDADPEELLGKLSAKYESNGNGAVIGYDKSGGTSYGKYQLASRPGTFKSFVMWFKKYNEDVYNAFVGADPAGWQRTDFGNTGSRNGVIPTLWKKYSSEGAIPTQLQYKFLFDTHYKPLMTRIAKNYPDIFTIVNGSTTLKQMMFSTAVQHGVGGASKLIAKLYKPGMSAEEFIKALYNSRAVAFSSSSAAIQESGKRRMSNEVNDVLSSLQQERSGTLNGENQGPTTNTNVNAPSSSSSGNEYRQASGGGYTGFNVGGGGRSAQSTASSSSSFSPSSSSYSQNRYSTTNPNETIQQKVLAPAEVEKRLGDLRTQNGVDLSGIVPRLKQAMVNLNAEFKERFGKDLIIKSGYRSLQKQAALYKKLGPGNAAKPSPYAPHIAGLAFDGDSAQMNQAEKAGLLQKHGLWRPLKNGLGRTKPEAWHVELEGSRDPRSLRVTQETIAKLGGPIPNQPGDSSESDIEKSDNIGQQVEDAAKKTEDQAQTTASSQSAVAVQSEDTLTGQTSATASAENTSIHSNTQQSGYGSSLSSNTASSYQAPFETTQATSSIATTDDVVKVLTQVSQILTAIASKFDIVIDNQKVGNTQLEKALANGVTNTTSEEKKNETTKANAPNNNREDPVNKTKSTNTVNLRKRPITYTGSSAHSWA